MTEIDSSVNTINDTSVHTPSFKISVSSHVNYGHALNIFLDSFDKSGVSKKDIVVTICGSKDEPVEIIETTPDREVIIYVPKNCYDLSHAFGLYNFIDHPRVKADYYINIHDTCIITEYYADRIAKFVQEMYRQNLDVMYALKTRQLNLVGMSYKFIKDHGHNYDKEIDKPAAWGAEHGGDLSYSSFVPPERVGQFDCPFTYQPGIPIYSDIIRHPIYIESMGIVKFVANDRADVNPPWQQRIRP